MNRHINLAINKSWSTATGRHVPLVVEQRALDREHSLVVIIIIRVLVSLVAGQWKIETFNLASYSSDYIIIY